MVCKEDVLSWFKDLECYKRIDFMYELLNMCMPFEIRFVGSCIEEIGKHSYQELRGLTIIANDVEKLSKDSLLNPGLLDESTRSRVLLYVSLLSAKNCTSANWFYKRLFRTAVLEDFIVKGNCKDDNIQSELLLLFTMGLHHPAFTFDQKTYFGKLLVHLLEQKEGKKRVSPKPSVYCYPPGFGYPTTHKLSIHSDVPVIPAKTASPMAAGDTPCHQPPPGLPIHAPIDFIPQPLWPRPAFAGNICGAPEIPPFPPPSLSPLVSQPTSPPSSRAASPHRAYTIRSMTGIPPQSIALPHTVELQQAASQLSMDPLSQASLHFSPDLKSADDELNHIPDDKLRDITWMNPMEMKAPNGIRMSYVKGAPPYFLEQMQALSLEGENSLHCSTSSSNSSLNQSPPQTPALSSVTPHGPGRGDSNPRVNGIPTFISTGPPAVPPMCESTPPPPFSNCTVPYSSYPAHVTLPAIPNRCIFQYSQAAYRPTFNTPFTTYPPTEGVYTSPYMVPMFSSVPPPAPRNPNCYNCGALGHVGADCSAQTIEDITQKAYTLEYSQPLPETEK